MNETTICVTGVGVVSSIGIGRDDFTLTLSRGGKNPGVVESFSVEDYLESEKTYLDRCSAFTLAACALALKDARLPLRFTPPLADSAGICLGTAYGCLQTMEDFFRRVLERGPRHANSLLFSHSYANTPASLASIEFGLRGFHSTVTAGESSSLLALVESFNALQLGYADCLLTGGVDVLSVPLKRVWANLYPGRVAGEGAVIFVLERAETVAARGLSPRAFPSLEVQFAQGKISDPLADDVEHAIGFIPGAMDAFTAAAALARLSLAESNGITWVSKSLPQYRFNLERK